MSRPKAGNFSKFFVSKWFRIYLLERVAFSRWPVPGWGSGALASQVGVLEVMRVLYVLVVLYLLLLYAAKFKPLL